MALPPLSCQGACSRCESCRALHGLTQQVVLQGASAGAHLAEPGLVRLARPPPAHARRPPLPPQALPRQLAPLSSRTCSACASSILVPFLLCVTLFSSEKTANSTQRQCLPKAAAHNVSPYHTCCRCNKQILAWTDMPPKHSNKEYTCVPKKRVGDRATSLEA